MSLLMPRSTFLSRLSISKLFLTSKNSLSGDTSIDRCIGYSNAPSAISVTLAGMERESIQVYLNALALIFFRLCGRMTVNFGSGSASIASCHPLRRKALATIVVTPSGIFNTPLLVTGHLSKVVLA